VHMESQDLASEQAETHIGEMTYRLLALFAAHQGAALGLDPVCTENLSSGVVVVKSAQDGV
jgi:hypothetical protein